MTKLSELPRIFESSTIKPSFKKVHVLLALIIFNDDSNKKGIGRYKLKKELVLTEGRVKSMLTRMKQMNLIRTDSRVSGHVISDDGIEMLGELQTHLTPPVVPNFNFKDLVVGNFAYYCIVKDSLENLKSGMEQRDEVIKIGGTGATCLIFLNKKLRFPGDTEMHSPDIDINDLQYHMNDGDILVIGTGENKDIARLGTLSAALSLIGIKN